MDITFLSSDNSEMAGDLIDQYVELVCGAFGHKKSLKAYNGLINDMLYNHSVVYIVGTTKEEGKSVVVCGAKLLFDYKITHDAYCVHIEDVCVNENYRGNGIATKLLNHIKTEFAKNSFRPVYKFHLYCKPALMELYNSARLLLTDSIVMEDRI